MKTFFYICPSIFITPFSIKFYTFNLPKPVFDSFQPFFYSFFGLFFFNKPLGQFFFYTFYNYNKFFYPFFSYNSFFVFDKNISVFGNFNIFFNRYYVFCYDFTNFSSFSFSPNFKKKNDHFFFSFMSQFFLTSCLEYTAGSTDLRFCNSKAYDFFVYLMFYVYPYWCTHF